MLADDEYSMGMNAGFGKVGLVLAFLGAVAIALSAVGRRLAWLFLPLPLISACFELAFGTLVVVDLFR